MVKWALYVIVAGAAFAELEDAVLVYCFLDLFLVVLNLFLLL